MLPYISDRVLKIYIMLKINVYLFLYSNILVNIDYVYNFFQISRSFGHFYCVFYSPALDFYFDNNGFRFILAFFVQVSLIYRNFGIAVHVFL
jgi:hypothetical protein